MPAPMIPVKNHPGIYKRGGRYVSTVKTIELRDPGPAQP